jgi:hypothetical protein
MSAPRLLRVRCPRWDQVEAFLRKKLRGDGRLSMKVPFADGLGAPVTVAIELPNQLVIALDGVVAAPAAGDRADAAVVQLTGARAAIERLEAMLADARASGAGADLGAMLAEREAALRRRRQQAAHEVLGCARRPTVDELRTAWRARVRAEHPDAVARFHSAALRLTAEETVIHVARAYERLRATVVADHGAVVAGTSVRTAGALVVDVGAQDGFDVVPLTPPVADTVESTVVTSVEVADEATAVTGPPRAVRGSTPPAPPDLTSVTGRRGAASVPPALALELDDLPVGPPAGPPPAPPIGLELDLPSPPPRPRPITARPPAPPVTTVEQSLRLARSGPGDRFVRAIRERLVDDDAAGAASLATAAAQVYPRDRRLAALCEIAAAQAAVTRGDRAAAIAATRAAIAADPDGDEARRVLAALEQGAALESGLIGEAYR